MAIRTELTMRLQNSPGALAGVCQTLAQEHINILALAMESAGVLRMVVDNHVHAAGVLKDHHHQVQQRDVLYTLVSNEPGALSRMIRLMADAGINLEYAYAAGVEGGAMAAVVLGVGDAQRASAAAGI